MSDIQHIRRTMAWGIPLYAAITAGCIFLIRHEVLPTLEAIVSHAPVVRVAPTAQLAPFVAILCMLGIVLGTMRSIPCDESITKKFERAFNVAVLVSMVVLVLVPVTAVVQRVYMPRGGYSMCAELKDAPSMWFTDWVRNPAWCVKGKSLEWVNEQARLATSTASP
ncbi:hypothetical protein M4R22_02995 [Acidovorax sp. GBBC 3334]|uniref:hypothetical protein n=1 Tax=unclassified Acidovorax TaxID=2684926 RepID=UPI002303778E|nr:MULTISPECIES: hypothetical protein [unclassified Acidovorax]MDA8453723.1 hypothetical protein [Acidovorax sp. GBBC 3334]MDA8522268.1 hypothetical protein [Acidovorax sp. NCPPB 4044]